MRGGHPRGPTGPALAGTTGSRGTYRGQMTDDLDLRHRITALVGEERDLRARLAGREISVSDEHERLRSVETELDRCWDLLRQRAALRDAGGNPDDARVRPEGVVEGYLE